MQFTFVTNSRSSMHNTNNWKLCIQKNKSHLIKQQDEGYITIDKINLYVTIHMTQNISILLKQVKNGLENLKDPTAFQEYSNNKNNVYKRIKE